MNKENLTVVGRIIKAFGLRGELKVHPEVFYDHFFKFKRFIVISPRGGEKVLRPLGFRSGAGKTIIVKFKEIDSRELAEKLGGLELMVPTDELPETGPNEFYVKDLIGCTVLFNNEVVGKVKDFLFQGFTGSIVVETNEQKEVFVPFVRRFVREVKTMEKEIFLVDFDELSSINP